MVKGSTVLSERQRRMMMFLEKYIEENGYPPTIRDIGEATEISSTSVVNYNLNKLVAAGYLERSDHVSRGLRLLKTLHGDTTSKRAKKFGNRFARVPLIGHIVASAPVQIPEDVGHHISEEDMMELPPTLLQGYDASETFALQVKGDSMIDAMIREGDIVVLRAQETAEPGDMVAVWLLEDGETTLKYYYPEGDKIRLQPAHPSMEAIYVSASNCQIKGKVISVLRMV
jgi:repressor LexA